MRGVRRGSGWIWFWLARRKGNADWYEASTTREAIRRATLLAPRRPPKWLGEAAAEAERQIMTGPHERPPFDEHEPAPEA